MFKKAFSIASKFTLPVIVSNRFFDGRVESGVASFILLNKDGWILTASHVVSSLLKAQDDLKALQEYRNKLDAISKDISLDSKAKRKRSNKIIPNKDWITNNSFWWACNSFRVEKYVGNNMADIAIGQIINFIEAPGQIYPKFLKSTENLIGESVCRIGFPFHNVSTTFDQQSSKFILANNTLPIPIFINDGVIARYNMIIGPDNSNAKYIETTTPGLRGQSGGPIINTNGEIVAMQVRTTHYALGFNPEVDLNGKKSIEPQFLNTGNGLSSENILQFLAENNVDVEIVQ